MTIAFFSAMLAWNLAVFLLYGVDKAKAKKGRRRISEKTLLFSTLLLGGIGGFAGMYVFHHKTRHLKFRILVPIGCILTLAAILVYLHFVVGAF